MTPASDSAFLSHSSADDGFVMELESLLQGLGVTRIFNDGDSIGHGEEFWADVHLHRARLFHDRAELAAARTLIEKHGYGRRREELADAETASKHWPEES